MQTLERVKDKIVEECYINGKELEYETGKLVQEYIDISTKEGFSTQEQYELSFEEFSGVRKIINMHRRGRDFDVSYRLQGETYFREKKGVVDSFSYEHYTGVSGDELTIRVY